MELQEGKMAGDSNPTTVSTKVQQIAEMARKWPGRALYTLAHRIDIEWLRTAYEATRKDSSPGVDGQTAEAYAEDLEANLSSLLVRFKTGTYRAPPVRRVYIPKDDGKQQRPIGMPTFEDKVLQRAVAMALEAVYEQEFFDCSYGFRRGRSQHMALERLRSDLMSMRGGTVLEIDISSFFDTVVHAHLRSFFDKRVTDGVIRRAIDKWLKAGVMEAGELTRPEDGTPQGGVISPLLANIYLHEVLDRWFDEQVKPRLRGRATLVRFADDAVLAFSDETDAKRVMKVLPKRFEKYGLTLHPTKTRLVQYRRPAQRKDDNHEGRPGTFDFLGFTHFWGRSRKGAWVVKQKTAAKRFRRTLKRIKEWCWRNMHRPLREQQAGLRRKLLGHYNYFGVTGNYASMRNVLHLVKRTWLRALRRRSQQPLSWERFERLLAHRRRDQRDPNAAVVMDQCAVACGAARRAKAAGS